MTPGSIVTAREGVVSLHGAPDADTEVVTQARLGDTARIEREAGGWLKLVLAHDGYEGWALASRFAPGGWPPDGAPVAVIRGLFAHLYAGPDVRSRLNLTAPLGAPLSLSGPAIPGEMRWWKVYSPGDGGTIHFIQAGDFCADGTEWAWTDPGRLREGLVKCARRLLGIPYRWGGTTPWGLDCSGLVQLVYRLHGIALPRDAHQQAADERMAPVAREDILPGDLLFFANLGHVGMAVSGEEFIHATTSGRPVVQLTAIDDGEWVRKRDGIKRLETGKAA